MSSLDGSDDFSALIGELQRHCNQSRLLQKLQDDTSRVLREIQAASCISQSTYSILTLSKVDSRYYPEIFVD